MRLSKTFCIYPWIHLHAEPAGEWTLCCHSTNDAIASVNEHDIESVWNSPKMRAIRLKMLQGEPLEQCQTCYTFEASRVPSYRAQANFNWRQHLWKAEQTKSDGSIEFPIVYLDIRFSNVCNLRCRMCGPDASSSWYRDAVTLGLTTNPLGAMDAWTENEPFWQQLREKILPSVEQIYFAGGEPLLQEAQYRLLDILQEIGRNDVELIYNTNLSTLEYKHYRPLEVWKNFEQVIISPSVDGADRRGEYIRKGSSWRQWLENLRQVESYLGWGSFTVSVYNILHYPDFYDLLQKEVPNLYPHGHLLLHPEYLSIQILSQEMKAQVETKYKDFLNHHPQLAPFVQRNITSWLNFMKVDKSHLAKAFKEHTSKLDELRGETFCDTFPELADWYRHI